jgi:hypothetical protein
MTWSIRTAAIILCATVSRPERRYSTRNCPIEVLRVKIWVGARPARLGCLADVPPLDRCWGRLPDKAKRR